MSLDNVPTTTLKCLVSVVLVVAVFAWIIVCDSIGHTINERNLQIIVDLVQVYAGITGLQFVGKRATTKPEVIRAENENIVKTEVHSYDPGA